MITEVLNQYESSMINKFDINANADGGYDLASDNDITGKIFSMLFPMLLMTFIFSACTSLAPESISGEKERGTLTTLLVTPVRRSEIAIGKILALSILALLSGLSSFTGTALSLPKLMAMSGDDVGVNVNVYHVQDYALLLMIVLCSVLLIISLISVVSAYAKNVKEAGTYVSPLMIIIMIVSISTMFGNWNAAGKLLVSDSDLQQRAVHEQCLFILGQCRACNDYLCIQSGLCGNFRMGTDRMFTAKRLCFLSKNKMQENARRL